MANKTKQRMSLRGSWFLGLIRPIAWIVFLLPIMGGFYLGATKDTPLSSILFGFGSLIFVLCFGFTVNALSDIDVDKYHDGRSKDMVLSRQPLVTGKISVRQANLFCLLFLAGSILCSLMLGLSFIILILLLDGIAYVYSHEPFRLKKRPVGDIIANALLAEFFFLAGITIGNGSWNPLLIIIVFLLAANFYIPTVMTDYEFDKKAGLRTSAVIFGGQRLVTAMYFLTAASCLIGLILIVSSSVEVQITAVMMIMYTPLLTIMTKQRLHGNQLLLHQNWMLVPFASLTLVFLCLGFLRVIS